MITADQPSSFLSALSESKRIRKNDGHEKLQKDGSVGFANREGACLFEKTQQEIDKRENNEFR
jgi:hypothetical protein